MKSSMFQYLFVAAFGVLGVAGLIYFATSDPEQDETLQGAAGSVTIWGTFPSSPALIEMMGQFNDKYKKSFTTNYVFHDPKTFDRDIVEALASGKGPDMLLLPDELILRHTDKIIPMAYSPQFGQREYQNMFLEASEVYLRPEGMLAFPFAVDPMVMYWNRDLFNNASVTVPPKYWDEFLLLTPKLTKKDKSFKFTQSAIAFGEYENVRNAKDVIAMLFLQAGSKIVSMNESRPLADVTGVSVGPNVAKVVESALRFYMDFSNPQKSIYTWSRSRANSEEEFVDGNLAVYFDYASRYNELKARNPHLNFDVAIVPQLRDAKTEIVMGKMYGLVTMKSSRNQQTAFTATRLLLDQAIVDKFSKAFSLPPVRRDMLANRPQDAVQAVFYDSAIRVKTWLDPKPEDSDIVFQTLVESISSGKNTPTSALADAQRRLQTLVEPYAK